MIKPGGMLFKNLNLHKAVRSVRNAIVIALEEVHNFFTPEE